MTPARQALPYVTEVLLRAATIVEERGLACGAYEDPQTGAVCALGALNMATSGNSATVLIGDAAWKALTRFLIASGQCSAIAQWSDSCRSARVVANTMRKAARAWQREHQA